MMPGDLVIIRSVQGKSVRGATTSLWSLPFNRNYDNTSVSFEIDWDTPFLLIAINDDWALLTNGVVFGWRATSTFSKLVDVALL